MANRPARYTKGDLTKALKAANETGFPVAGYEIDPNGTIRVLFGNEPAAPMNTLEERAEAYAQARRMARRRA